MLAGVPSRCKKLVDQPTSQPLIRRSGEGAKDRGCFGKSKGRDMPSSRRTELSKDVSGDSL